MKRLAAITNRHRIAGFFHWLLVQCWNLLKTGPDALLKWAQLFALVAAGYWALYQFGLGGSDGWQINLDLTTEVLPYNDQSRLLIVHVKAKNPRTTEVEFIKPKDKFAITVRKISDSLKDGTVIQEESGEPLAQSDLLDGIDSYEFLPNAEFDDMVTFVLPAGKTYIIKADLEKSTDTSDTNSVSKLVKIDQGPH